jgi:hypothetical protein
MIYIIPYRERFVDIGKTRSCKTVIDNNGIGIVVTHDKEQVIDVRNYLIGLSDQRLARVDAANPKEALNKLFTEWVGFKTGTISKAQEISKRCAIIEYPDCKDMVEMNNGWDGCAKREWNGRLSPKSESYCGCVIDGYDKPRDCPIGNDMSIMRASYVEETIDGYLFKRSSTRKDFGVKTRGIKDEKVKTIIFDLYKKEIINTLLEKDPKKFDMKQLKDKVSNLNYIHTEILNPTKD